MAQQNTLRLGIRTAPVQLDLTAPDALHRATLHDRQDNVLKLLDSGFDVNLVESKGWTALQVASAHGHADIAAILLARGANTEARYQHSTPLHIAAVKGFSEIITLLLKHNADPNVKRSDGQTPLHLAVRNGQKDSVRALANGGALLEEPSEDRGFNSLHIACQLGYSGCAAELLTAGASPESPAVFGFTPLMVAAMSDHPDAISTLLESGADLNAKSESGQTASMVAAHFGSSTALRYLISGGANLDVVDKGGNDALKLAIMQQHSSTALLLLHERIHLDTHDIRHKNTALHLAVSTNQLTVLQALLDKGVDLKACDADGDTALQWAVEGDKMVMVKSLLRAGAQINKRNDRTGETVLHWAVRCGHVSMTQALLAHGSDPSLVDLAALQKRDHAKSEDVDDEDFQTCKILVETAQVTEMRTLPPEQFEWSLSQESDVQEDPQEDAVVPPNTGTSDAIINPIYEMPDQAAADSFVAAFQDKVIHDGVKCTGPHCAKRSGSLCGIRYKCTWCDVVDLCSTCICSYFNNHEHSHPMIKCLLPTSIHKIEEIDENTRQSCVQSSKEGGMRPEDLTHIMYALTDQVALRQLQIDLSVASRLDWSQAASLQDASGPTLFAIFKQGPTKESRPQKPRLIQRNEPTVPSLDMYKVTKSGNVILEHFPIGQASLVQDGEQVIHYQDPGLLTKVITRQMKRFEYHQDSTFRKWAWDGRTVTRVIDLKPGLFDDKIEIELRTIDLEQGPIFEALSYTWKETSYERALRKNTSKEVDFTVRSIARHSHGVYCHNADGSEAFLTVNTGLRDALQRLRDPSHTKTFWIDQLAINQLDVKERAFQVQAMRICYNRARRVLVWTGDEDTRTRIIFDLYRKITSMHRNLKRFPTPDEFVQLSAIDAIDGLTLSAMYEFFRRPVFGRSWCIQEIVVGQKVVVKCGEFEIDWVDLWFAALVLATSPWLENLRSEGGVLEQASATGSFSEDDKGELPVDQLGSLTELITVAELREDFQSNKETSLEALLYATGRFQVTEPRDKIYAVLGIRGVNVYPGRQPDDLRADYEKSNAEAFTTATKFCIQQSDSLHMCGMVDTLSRKKIVGLPSWVPDFSCNDLSSLFAYCRPRPQIPYNACGDVPLTVAWPYEQHTDVLVTSSCHVEHIETFSPHAMSNTKNFATVLAEWSGLVTDGPTYPTGEFAPDVFLTTCFTDSAGRYRLRDSPQPQAFMDAMLMLIAEYFMQDLMDKSPDGDGMNSMAHWSKIGATIMTEAMEKFPRAWGIDEPIEDDKTADQQEPGSIAIKEVPAGMNSRDISPRETSPFSADRNQLAVVASSADTNSDGSSVGPDIKDKGKGKASEPLLTDPTLTSPSTTSSSPDVSPEMRAIANESLVMACFNRKFFTTRNAYFGLGPADMQKDDEIHILSGTKVPFVLRRITDANAETNGVAQDVIDAVGQDVLSLYQMIGECFVHGYMQGEVTGREDLEWDGIAIC